MSTIPAVAVKDLTFNYGTLTGALLLIAQRARNPRSNNPNPSHPASVLAGFKPVLTDMNVEIPRGTRTLLVGDNGAGKSTLLRILSGKHIHPVGSVTVLGRESL